MKERKRIGILIFIMLIAALIVGGVSIGILYGTAINEQKERLVDTVKFQARLIEAVAQFNAEFTHKDLKKGLFPKCWDFLLIINRPNMSKIKLLNNL